HLADVLRAPVVKVRRAGSETAQWGHPEPGEVRPLSAAAALPQVADLTGLAGGVVLHRHDRQLLAAVRGIGNAEVHHPDHRMAAHVRRVVAGTAGASNRILAE